MSFTGQLLINNSFGETGINGMIVSDMTSDTRMICKAWSGLMCFPMRGGGVVVNVKNTEYS
jgi:hypothetical protein